jgi:quinol monooxygenase YgiN
MPFLMLVEMVFHADGAAAFAAHLPRMREEMQRIPGCLRLAIASEPEGRYTFTSLWEDDAALQRWVDNAFHREVLMANFRHWAIEAWFSRWELADDAPRSRRCPRCERWTRAQPGVSGTEPARCRYCGAAFGGR